MNLKELEGLLAQARLEGATDNTVVYLTARRLRYMRNITTVHFSRNSWPEKEWPVVITMK